MFPGWGVGILDATAVATDAGRRSHAFLRKLDERWAQTSTHSQSDVTDRMPVLAMVSLDSSEIISTNPTPHISKILSWNSKDALRELGSYILRNTSTPWQLKAPDTKPTIKQLKEARKGNGPPRNRNRWPRKGNGPPVTRTEGPFNLIATVPLAALIVGSCVELLRNGQTIGPQLA